MSIHRNYQKLKELSDYRDLDSPSRVICSNPAQPNCDSQMILRMLVRAKYGEFKIPDSLEWLRETILDVSDFDAALTGIKESWCYVTVRHGPVVSVTDDQWHFDGASFRTDIVPERNYVWVNHTPFQFKTGRLNFPVDFNPIKYDLFSFAEKELKNSPIQVSKSATWYLVNPFVFHRRNPAIPEGSRTFIRISFPDIEGRDIMNTENPMLPTPFFGRDPVKTFRNNLLKYS